MKGPVIDETKLSEVKRIICDADSLMSEKDCENDSISKNELKKLQTRLREITGNQQINIKNFCIMMRRQAWKLWQDLLF